LSDTPFEVGIFVRVVFDPVGLQHGRCEAASSTSKESIISFSCEHVDARTEVAASVRTVAPLLAFG
jgi:hypothetical protein